MGKKGESVRDGGVVRVWDIIRFASRARARVRFYGPVSLDARKRERVYLLPAPAANSQIGRKFYRIINLGCILYSSFRTTTTVPAAAAARAFGVDVVVRGPRTRDIPDGAAHSVKIRRVCIQV